MDWDDLLRRPVLSGLPLSLVVALETDEGRAWEQAAQRGSALLANRHRDDEVVILAPATEDEPAMVGLYRHCRITTLPCAQPTSGAALARALSDPARRPTILLGDAAVSIHHPQLRDLIDRLDQCDLVGVRRRSARVGWRWPLERILRGCLGVPIPDALGAWAALRRDAFAQVPLQLPRPLWTFELLAKLTYFGGTIDEADWPEGPGPTHLLATLWEHRGAVADLLFRPRFWSGDPRQGKTPLHRLAAPRARQHWPTALNRWPRASSANPTPLLGLFASGSRRPGLVTRYGSLARRFR